MLMLGVRCFYGQGPSRSSGVCVYLWKGDANEKHVKQYFGHDIGSGARSACVGDGNRCARLLPGSVPPWPGHRGASDQSELDPYGQSHHTSLFSHGNVAARWQRLGSGVLVVAGRDNDLRIRDNAELYDPAAGTWSVTGSLNTARILHTATLLQNGKVLVAGGGVAPGLPNTAELYDPVTGTWSPTGSLAAAHAGHTATLLPNGKVLVSGGTDNFSVLHTAELYDPTTGTWGPAGSPTWARSGHTATLLQNGSVLVAGGIVGPYDADNEFPAASNAELYDPVAGSWRSVGTAIRLYEHTATLLPSGKVLMAGGYSIRPIGPGGLAVTSRGAELYDPAGEAWSYTGYLSVTRVGHTASLLPNGKVLVAGGALGAGNYAEL
jgi:hypothetical protein